MEDLCFFRITCTDELSPVRSETFLKKLKRTFMIIIVVVVVYVSIISEVKGTIELLSIEEDTVLDSFDRHVRMEDDGCVYLWPDRLMGLLPLE